MLGTKLVVPYDIASPITHLHPHPPPHTHTTPHTHTPPPPTHTPPPQAAAKNLFKISSAGLKAGFVIELNHGQDRDWALLQNQVTNNTVIELFELLKWGTKQEFSGTMNLFSSPL